MTLDANGIRHMVVRIKQAEKLYSFSDKYTWIKKSDPTIPYINANR